MRCIVVSCLWVSEMTVWEGKGRRTSNSFLLILNYNSRLDSVSYEHVERIKDYIHTLARRSRNAFVQLVEAILDLLRIDCSAATLSRIRRFPTCSAIAKRVTSDEGRNSTREGRTFNPRRKFRLSPPFFANTFLSASFRLTHPILRGYF